MSFTRILHTTSGKYGYRFLTKIKCIGITKFKHHELKTVYSIVDVSAHTQDGNCTCGCIIIGF